MDIVVAQGYEAGGHRGSFTTINGEFPLVGTLSLVPQIVDTCLYQLLQLVVLWMEEV